MALTRLQKAGEEVGLVVSAEKPKAMGIGDTIANVGDEGHTIKQVSSFCYLGSTGTPTNSIEQEVTIRIVKVASTFRLLRNIWKAKIQLQTKLRKY